MADTAAQSESKLWDRIARFDDHFTLNLLINNKLC